MSSNEFKKYNPFWRYFDLDCYDSTLLRDFGFIDDEKHELFSKVICQERDISPPLKSVKMYVDEFDTKVYRLLEQDDCFNLLKKITLPLQMKHWELAVSQDYYPTPVSLEEAIDNFKSKERSWSRNKKNRTSKRYSQNTYSSH